MKALTVQQPWAWAIATGRKSVENRTWKTNYRGLLAIHAAASHRRLNHLRHLFPDLPKNLSFGAIVAIVTLQDCVPIAQCRELPYAEGPWCWILKDPILLPVPYPCAGALSLWTPSAEFLRRGNPAASASSHQGIPA